MIKLIRNNQKKFLAGGGVVLMITFIAGYGGTPRNGREGPVDHEVGKVDGKPVMASDLGAAERELTAVNQYVRRFDPRQTNGQPESLLERAFGRDVASNLLHRPELFVLLRREALNAGVVPSPVAAQQYMDDYLGGTAADGTTVDVPSPDSDTYKVIEDGVTDLMTVASYYGRVTAALKASSPAVDRALATVRQSIQLTLVPVPAEKFKALVPPPAPAALAEQFKKYADVAPGHPDASNPFGFGYRVPMLARLQYLRLSRDAVEKTIVAGKSDYDWEVDARKLYYAHPDQFAVSPPTTRATDVPGPAVTPPFEKVRDQALKSLRDPQVQALQDQVQQYLTSTLARDFAAYQSAITAGGSAPATAAGPAYDSPAYLPAVATAADAQFHVKVEAVTTDPLSPQQLQDLPHLGTAYAAVSSATVADGSLPGYVSDRSIAYLGSGDPKPPAATAELLRPSPAFTEAAGDAVDVIRLSDVQPSHPPAGLDAVRDAVSGDVTLAAAFDLAKAQADSLTAAAATGALPITAVSAGLNPIATQPLSMDDVSVDGLNPPLGDAAHDFLTQAYGLLGSFDPLKNPHPATSITLPGQRRVIVAQLTFVNARWSPADYYQSRMEMAAELQHDQANAARVGWFGADAITQRTGYKPDVAPSGS
jgi:hypothetical protein